MAAAVAGAWHGGFGHEPAHRGRKRSRRQLHHAGGAGLWPRHGNPAQRQCGLCRPRTIETHRVGCDEVAINPAESEGWVMISRDLSIALMEAIKAHAKRHYAGMID